MMSDLRGGGGGGQAKSDKIGQWGIGRGAKIGRPIILDFFSHFFPLQPNFFYTFAVCLLHR